MSGEGLIPDRAPCCGMSWRFFPPTRVDEPVLVQALVGQKTFRPGSFVRCIGCKDLYFAPEPQEPTDGQGSRHRRRP